MKILLLNFNHFFKMYNVSYGRKEPIRSLVKQSDEINPKILPLDKLLKFINSKVLTYYFEQVSIFLRNTKKDLWFPKISPYLDAFLVRIIKDVQNIEMLLENFDEKSKKFALEIIESLKANEKVYQLTYNYESCKIDMNILVYKKIYLNKPDMQLASPIVKICPKKSGTESDPAGNSQDVTTASTPPHDFFPYKSLCLTMTLQFIKDHTKRYLEYPEMSYNEADYMYSLIKRDKRDDSDPLYIKLWDALKEFYLTHEIKNSFLYVAGNRVQLSIEKVPINNNKMDEKSSPSTSKSSETDLDSKMSKAQKLLAKKKRLIDSLEKSFMNTALKMILDFICNEAEASLVFNNANEEQCLFIQCACSMAKMKKTHALFAEDSRALLRNIAKSLSADVVFDLVIDVAKMQKNNLLRTVSLKKEPKFSSNKRNKQSIIDFEGADKIEPIKGGISETIVNESKTPINIPKEPITVEAEKKVEESAYKELVDKEDIQGAHSVPRPTNKNNVEKIETIVNGTAQENVNNIETVVDSTVEKNVKENETIVDGTVDINVNKIETVVCGLTDNEKEPNKQVFGRKAKLVEAMSVPLEIDIAMRMMRHMGWQGGPLGVRGDGITEPLMPALHLASGAGLGHSRSDKMKKESSRFVELLREIIMLLKQHKNERAIKYNTPLSKKEKQFVTNILKSFSNRRRIECNDIIKGAVNEIMDVLKNTPTVQLDYQLSADRKKLTLIKVFRQAIPTVSNDASLNNKNNIPMAIIPTVTPKNNEYNYTLVPEPLSVEWIVKIGKYFSDTCIKNTKADRKLGHKIGVLSKILNFFKEDCMESKMSFEYELTKKQVRFINEAVKRINEGGSCFNNNIELRIVSNIRELAKDIYLTVFIMSRKYLCMKKTFKQTTITNSAKEMCDTANNNNNIDDKNKNKKESVAIVKNTVTKDTNKDTKNNIELDKNIKETLNDIVLEKIVNDMKIEKQESSVAAKPLHEITEDSELKKDIEALEKAIRQSDLKELNNDNLSFPSSKRSRSESKNSYKLINKKSKFDENVTFLYITTKDNKISTENAQEFQNAISEKIDLALKLPLIECFGIQNDALVYGCSNKVGALFLDSIARENNLKTTITTEFKEKDRAAVKMKLNSYVSVNLKNLFNKIERYNEGLSTDLWSVTDVQKHGDFIVILLEVDDTSLEYISEAKFSLFAGIDKVRFSIDWN